MDMSGVPPHVVQETYARRVYVWIIHVTIEGLQTLGVCCYDGGMQIASLCHLEIAHMIRPHLWINT